MGAAHSKSEDDEKVFYNETPIEFGQDVVDNLSDRLVSPETTPERQSTLDSHIRSRIQAELEHLRREEEEVRQQIEQALERENLDKERTLADSEGEGAGAVKSSAALLGDLEEVRSKVDRFHAKRELSDFPAVKESAEAVAQCYQTHATTPLDCWREVQKFKASVAQVEQEHLSSLQS